MTRFIDSIYSIKNVVEFQFLRVFGHEILMEFSKSVQHFFEFIRLW